MNYLLQLLMMKLLNTSESGIILDYQGPVDLPVIESLLKKLKKTKDFAALDITTGKRTYAIVVECLENIFMHSISNSSPDLRLQPHITVRKEIDQILIVSGNPVSHEIKDNLVRMLDQINKLDEPALKTLYQRKINRELNHDDKRAGLGLISMALKSGNNISYSFNPLTIGYLYFKLQISLNKYTMRKLIIDQTSSSPKVILDPEKKIFQISGESRPPDVREFYDHILSWMDDFSQHLLKTGELKDPVTFNFNFVYFNSSSGKFILDICKILASLRTRGLNIIVNWHFEKDDADMLEVGKEMSKIVKFPFIYVESGAN